MRRVAARLLPRLLAGAPEAASTVQQAELALLPRLAVGAASAGRQQAPAALAFRSFRSATAAFQSALVDTLGQELAYEKENYAQPEEVKVGPPGGFSLTETEGDTLLSLVKDYRGERVTVDVMVNDQPEEEIMEDESGAVDADVGAVFTASVTKGDQSLVFECKTDGQYFTVIHVSLEPASGEMEDSAYNGPAYDELDEELQAHFERYLAERGVNEELGAYLLPLIHDKEQREYMRWLANVKDFVAK